MRFIVALWLATATFAASPRDVFPISEVRPGQKGYGLTVFRGTTPERFDVEVIGVLRQFLPKQDLILIRMDHAVLREAGIIAGMSGSPIYLDGRLAGAVAYGFSFSKQPIAGVTPIENMLEDLRRPLRGPGRAAVATILPWLQRLPIPIAPSQGWQRVSLPLSAAGFPESVVGEMEQIFSPWRLSPMQGGGTGDLRAGPSSFVPGAPLGVQLVRGDLSLVGTGTVTHVVGDRVLAFGHPFFGAGELYAPIVAAEIHTVIPSVMRSFKMSSPLRVLGTLQQDRQAAIIGRQGPTPPMIPVRLEVVAEGEKPRLFSVEIVQHRVLAPVLAGLVALSGVKQAASDVADVVIRIRGRLRVAGYGDVMLESHRFSRNGIDADVIGSSTPVTAIQMLLSNTFEPVRLERIDLQVSADFRSEFVEIVEARLPGEEVDPGGRVELELILQPYGKPVETLRVPLQVPQHVAGQTLKVVAASGSAMEPERAPPETLRDLVTWLKRDYPDDAVVVSVYTTGESLAVRGSIVPDLPQSVIDVLRPGASSRRGVGRRAALHQVKSVGRVVFGRAEVDLKVRKEILR